MARITLACSVKSFKPLPASIEGNTMRVFSILTLLVVIFFYAPAVGYADPKPVGVVKSIKNTAFITRNGVPLAASTGMEIRNGDVIKTGSDGSIGLIFMDDTVVSMGPKSHIVVEEFLFEPVEGKLSFITQMIQGSVSFLSGQIAKLAPGSARVEIPAATIGVRGTHVLVQVEGE